MDADLAGRNATLAPANCILHVLSLFITSTCKFMECACKAKGAGKDKTKCATMESKLVCY